MNQIINPNDTKTLQMKYMTGELEGLRKVIAYLYDGNQQAFNHILFIKGSYKQWPEMLTWLKRNQLFGKSLVEFFANASPDGGGTHMGATFIISRLDGMKHRERMIKIDELM